MTSPATVKSFAAPTIKILRSEESVALPSFDSTEIVLAASEEPRVTVALGASWMLLVETDKTVDSESISPKVLEPVRVERKVR